MEGNPQSQTGKKKKRRAAKLSLPVLYIFWQLFTDLSLWCQIICLVAGLCNCVDVLPAFWSLAYTETTSHMINSDESSETGRSIMKVRRWLRADLIHVLFRPTWLVLFDKTSITFVHGNTLNFDYTGRKICMRRYRPQAEVELCNSALYLSHVQNTLIAFSIWCIKLHQNARVLKTIKSMQFFCNLILYKPNHIKMFLLLAFDN